MSAVCAAFAAKPSAYPSSSRKPDVVPTCGSGAGTARAEKGCLRADFGRGEPQAAKQDKAAGRAPLGSHICPRCGQFRAIYGAFQKQRKTALGCCRMKKSPSFQGKRRGSDEKYEVNTKMVKGKEKFALWITPECKQLVDDCYADDQCQSRSEYIEKGNLILYRLLIRRKS